MVKAWTSAQAPAAAPLALARCREPAAPPPAWALPGQPPIAPSLQTSTCTDMCAHHFARARPLLRCTSHSTYLVLCACRFGSGISCVPCAAGTIPQGDSCATILLNLPSGKVPSSKAALISCTHGMSLLSGDASSMLFASGECSSARSCARSARAACSLSLVASKAWLSLRGSHCLCGLFSRPPPAPAAAVAARVVAARVHFSTSVHTIVPEREPSCFLP